jgi:hypothetical protein
MREDDFVVYLAAFLTVAAQQLPKLPPTDQFQGRGISRAWALMAIAASDVTAHRPLRAPADLAAEVDRVCAGATPVPPKS